jgi:hypothetical protein
MRELTTAANLHLHTVAQCSYKRQTKERRQTRCCTAHCGVPLRLWCARHISIISFSSPRWSFALLAPGRGHAHQDCFPARKWWTPPCHTHIQCMQSSNEATTHYTNTDYTQPALHLLGLRVGGSVPLRYHAQLANLPPGTHSRHASHDHLPPHTQHHQYTHLLWTRAYAKVGVLPLGPLRKDACREAASQPVGGSKPRAWITTGATTTQHGEPTPPHTRRPFATALGCVHSPS